LLGQRRYQDPEIETQEASNSPKECWIRG